MALDLNKPIDEADEQALPDVNDEIAEVEIHLGQEEDQLGGDVQGGDNHVLPFDLNIDAPGPQVLPFDLNIDAPGHQGEMNLDNGDAMDQVLQLYGGHIHNAFPFDINSDAFEEHLQMQAGVPKSTLHRMLKEGILRRHSNTLKPLLKEENKRSRLRWCLSMLDWHTLPNEPKFVDMRNIVHIDENWFNTTKKTRNFYMVHWEDDPYRPVQNKNSIDKVMFLAAVARPRYNEEGICTFDGKIGLWPFTKKEPAQRASQNRPRGTLVTKTIKKDIEQEFQAYDDNKLNRVFLTLQSCLLEVMEVDGGNGYRIPHMGKERLELLDILPNTLSCGRQLYDKVRTALSNQVQ
uniref:Transposon protein, putative, Mariner sub-class n=1 Tax=Oryza sativa subsp. japonica TaxID=39947 RepID=Q2QWH2_ORYSJ|nr:transposon protein, putative, Mariner sub-class [Oryza sativa Japonica Group]